MEERNKHLLNLAEQRAMQADTLQATIDQIPKSDLLAKLVIDQNKSYEKIAQLLQESSTQLNSG